jgi:NAD(P)-dependent dehydrogenase (short-subunit alcohol dehydrogenase family)
MPPPRGTPNPIEGPGDFTVTKTVHNGTYPAVDPTRQDLSGKAVLITGASRGIGASIATSFAKAGASYIILGARSSLETTSNAIKKAALEAGRPEPQILQWKLDVTDPTSVSNAAAEVKRAVGRLDVIVNNAGLIDMAMIQESNPEKWWGVWEVNVKGPFLVAKYFLPLMLEREDSLKQVVTVSRYAHDDAPHTPSHNPLTANSSVGAHLTLPSLSAYQPSKLAVLRFTQFIDAEYSSQGVTAITIHPGNILTEMATSGDIPEELRFVFTESVELPADTIVWLTAKKREWLGGRYVNVTWDMLELEEKREVIVGGDRLKVKLDVDF